VLSLYHYGKIFANLDENRYIIICIFIGAFIGAFIFQWESILLGTMLQPQEEATVCCG